MLNFPNPDKNAYVGVGKAKDEANRRFIRSAIGVTPKKVEPKQHYLLSGPRGVGKTYGALDELKKGNKKFILLTPGMSMPAFTVKLATAVYKLKSNEQLVVLTDDADDVFFSKYETLQKWKNAFAKTDPDIGFVPYFSHEKDITSMIRNLEKADKSLEAEALSSFREEGSIGVVIPTDQCRFTVLCNLNFDDEEFLKKSFGAKMRNAIDPVLDRFEREHIGEESWKESWGWLAYVLGTTQPFEGKGYKLTDAQKKELLNWMWDKWTFMRSTSYRTVESMCAAMINEPTDYEIEWETYLRKS